MLTVHNNSLHLILQIMFIICTPYIVNVMSSISDSSYVFYVSHTMFTNRRGKQGVYELAVVRFSSGAHRFLSKVKGGLA